jgi:hypothetical protein
MPNEENQVFGRDIACPPLVRKCARLDDLSMISFVTNDVAGFLLVLLFGSAQHLPQDSQCRGWDLALRQRRTSVVEFNQDICMVRVSEPSGRFLACICTPMEPD